MIPVVTGALGRIGTGTRRLRYQKTSRDHANYMIKIGQNTKKSPGDLSRFVVTQTLVRKHPLLLV